MQFYSSVWIHFGGNSFWPTSLGVVAFGRQYSWIFCEGSRILCTLGVRHATSLIPSLVKSRTVRKLQVCMVWNSPPKVCHQFRRISNTKDDWSWLKMFSCFFENLICWESWRMVKKWASNGHPPNAKNHHSAGGEKTLGNAQGCYECTSGRVKDHSRKHGSHNLRMQRRNSPSDMPQENPTYPKIV